MSRRSIGKKIREEQEATAHVFQEFINAFQEPTPTTKTFVKSEVLYADKNELTPLENRLYQPIPLIKNIKANQNALECARLFKDDSSQRKSSEKPKSNLESLKEELKLRHSEKQQRDVLKEIMASEPPAISYFDGGDPNSTNLFVSNLNANISEMNLMQQFGAYGPLASVKIMWPRGDDRFKGSNTNCGFVAYMSRKDAERALNNMRQRTDMRVGWGKSVEIPSHPIFIPQELLRIYLPPPQSGLPFNAQIVGKLSGADPEVVLSESIVKVTIPLNRKVLVLINRMVEFVVKEGPMFEAMVMNNELGNSEFNFLFDNKSPSHIYYRWKLFSILQGDGQKEWSLKPFRMFRGGSIWTPPTAPNYQAGMPEQLIKKTDKNTFLSDNQCERLIQLLQNLTLSRSSIAEAMVFCLNHESALQDSMEIIMESVCNASTEPPRKVARLYLLFDVLTNAQAKQIKLAHVETKLPTVMDELYNFLTTIPQNVDKSLFSSKVTRTARQLGLNGFINVDLVSKFEDYINETLEEDNSSCDEPLDGANLIRRMKNGTDECILTPKCLQAKQENKIKQEYFVPSKWDTLDPEEVESQSMSSTKLYYIELEKELKELESVDDKKLVEKKKRKKDKERSPERHSKKRKEEHRQKKKSSKR